MEWIFIIGVVLLITFPHILLVIDFIKYLSRGHRSMDKMSVDIFEFYVVVFLPIFIVVGSFGQENDCCTDSAVFSVDHSLSFYIWVVIVIIAFSYSRIRKTILPPIPEILLNGLLMLGILLNIVLIMHGDGNQDFILISWIGHLPIILSLILALVENQKLLLKYIEEHEFNLDSNLSSLGIRILTSPSLIKYPIILILTLPLIIVITAMLMLFGQKPDAMIRVFTETYKHGFSQLDFECDNVQCGGHYLCSVAANGNVDRVKPIRYGVRAGGRIICNRQLLASNAFENVIETKLPRLHKSIRKYYDKIGDSVHQHYHFFNIKIVSDIVYIAMKPLEWFFIVVLYCTDVNPENRIALQYIDRKAFDVYQKELD